MIINFFKQGMADLIALFKGNDSSNKCLVNKSAGYEFELEPRISVSSHGVTYQVILKRTHLNDNLPTSMNRYMDQTIIINRNNRDEANWEGEKWADFLGLEFKRIEKDVEPLHPDRPNMVNEWGPSWSDQLMLTEKEICFLLAVYSSPDFKYPLASGPFGLGDYTNEAGLAIWKIPEELGYIVSTGSYRWKPTQKLIDLIVKNLMDTLKSHALTPAEKAA